MSKTRDQSRLAATLGILLICAAQPACKAPDGSRISPFARPTPDSTNTVLRPPFPWPETKPLFVSGYAGADYNPTTRARPVYSNGASAGLPSTRSTITVDEGTWNSN